MALNNYEATYRALGICLASRTPVVLWGPPGQGKTSVIRDLAAHQGRGLEVLLASIREPQDFAGLPIMSDGRMRLAPPEWAVRLAEEGNGILFLDEVNTAPPSVQAALLRVCLDRVAGDFPLGDGTSIVAAANPPEIAADGWDLAPPLANRFCHLDWELPVDVVRSGFAGHWPTFDFDPIKEEEAVLAADMERLTIGSFLGSRADLLTAVPKSAAEQGRSFPTPRTWEMAGTLLGWAKAAGMPDQVVHILLAGAVGRGVAAEYVSYRDRLDLINPEDALANADTFELPKRADKVYVLAGMVILALQGNCTPQRWLAAGTILDRIAAAGLPDVATTQARRWMLAKPEDVEVDPAQLVSMLPLLIAMGVPL